jgi:hypothetical protein
MKKELPLVDCIRYWTPRALIILEGSVKRSVNSNYWAQKVIKDMVGQGDKLVISDLRYKSEAEQLKATFGDDLTLIRVNRFRNVDSNDPSERDLDDYDFDVTIDNYEGDIKVLYKDLDELMLLEGVAKK